MQGNLANTYEKYGRLEEALALRREGYARRRALAPEHPHTLSAALNLATSLVNNSRFAEARAIASEMLPIARRLHGDAHDATLGFRFALPKSIVQNPGATQNDLRVAKEELEDLLGTTRRIFGNSHPRVELVRTLLEETNDRLS